MTMLIQLFNKVTQDLEFKGLLSGSAVIFIFKISGVAGGFIATILTIRLYGTAALGILALVYVVFQFATILARGGLDIASLRFIALHWEKGKPVAKDIFQKSLLLMIGTSVILSVLLYFLAVPIASGIFNKPHLAEYIRWASFFILPHTLLFLCKESLRATKNISGYSFFNFASISFISIFLLYLFHFESTEEYIPVIVFLIAVVLSAIAAIFLWVRKSGLRAITGRTEYSYPLLIKTAVPLGTGALVLFLSSYTAMIILGIYTTETEVGIFEMIHKVAAFTGIFLMAVNGVAAPRYAEMNKKKDHKELQQIISKASLLICILSIPLLLLLFLFAQPVLGAFGEEIKSEALALQILLIGFTINVLAGPVGVIMQMTGLQIYFMGITLASGVVILILSLFLIPAYGITGAAIATSISLGLWNILAVIAVRVKKGLWPFWLPSGNY